MTPLVQGSRRWWSLAAMALGVLAMGFDMTILNVALPTLGADLEASTSELQWIVDAYALVFAAALLPFGLLGDRFGRKRVLLSGLTLFGLASLAGALATGPGEVIAARALMGLGAATILPLSMSILPSIFPPEERTRAIAIWSSAMALGLPLGPILGGWLLEHFWWGSIFVLNVPIVAVAVLAAVFLLPESRDPATPRIDVPGVLLSMLALSTLVLGVIEGPSRGWTDPMVLGSLVASVILLAAFVWWEGRTGHPIIDIGMLRDGRLLWPAVAATMVSLVIAGVLFVLPLFFQVVQGHDAMGTGFRLIPLLLGLMVGGLATDRVAPRTGHKPIIIAGLLVLALGSALGAFGGAGSSYAFSATWMAVMGLGLGLSMVPSMDAAMAAIPDDRAGRGSGMVQTMRQTGGALGIAGLVSLLSGVYQARLDTGRLPADAAETARESVGAAASLATKLGDPGLLASARDSYMAGMSAVMVTCSVLAAGMAAVAWRFLPAESGVRATGQPDETESPYEHAAS